MMVREATSFGEGFKIRKYKAVGVKIVGIDGGYRKLRNPEELSRCLERPIFCPASALCFKVGADRWMLKKKEGKFEQDDIDWIRGVCIRYMRSV